MLSLVPSPEFEHLANQVLRLKRVKAPKTQRSALLQIGRLIENFKSVSVVDITEDLWTDYVVREMKKRRRKFYDDRKYMKMILISAQRRNMIARVPPLPIPDPPCDAGREILPEELELLEKHANMTLRFQIRIGWKMGLRLREMMKLRWDQFDWRGKAIVFRPADTKTRKGRVVLVPDDLWAEFLARKAVASSAWVFPSRGGRKPQDNNKTAWRALKSKTKIRARWHDLRHTCATLSLRRGVHIHIVSRYLGMSDVVLSRIYLHVSRDDLKQFPNAMGDRIS